jgi:thiamine biosynthesis lipoprotein
MDRRDFLDPRRIAESAGQVVGAASLVGETPSETLQEDMTLVRYARAAMGTVFEVVMPFGHGLPTEAVNESLDLIDALEGQLSIYRESSEVSELNRRALSEAVVVEGGLFGLLQRSVSLSAATDGAFDVTAGALVQAWGFFKGPRRVPRDDERTAALARTGWRHLILDPGQRTVRFAVEGLQINLGSIGKGYALDRVATHLREAWGEPAGLIHGGKSSVYGLGTPPGESRGWSVGLEHPWNPERPLATVYLRDRAMATSAATYKHLVHEGKKLGHILDPRTGWPAQGIASATTICPEAAEADALATAFYILGVEGTAAYCRDHPEVGAILLREGAAETVMFNVNGPGQAVVNVPSPL